MKTTRLTAYKETFFLAHAGSFSLLFAILIVFSYFLIDRPLAYFFSQHPFATSFSKIIATVFHPNYAVLLTPVLFYCIRFLWKKKEWGNILLFFMLSIVVANCLDFLLKYMIGRDRPFLLFTQDLYGFTPFSSQNVRNSFPSGHATTISAIFFSLACLRPKESWVYLGVTFLLCFTRVILTAHFLSDILGGMWLGMLISQFIYVTMREEHYSFKARFK